MIVLKPEATFVNSEGKTIVNESVDIEELTKDDGCIKDQIYFIANSVGIPNNEVWLLDGYHWKIRTEESDDGSKIYRRYLCFGLYPPHTQGPDKSNMLIAAGLNYVQLSQCYQIIELESKNSVITGDISAMVKGDANCDGDVDMADAVLIMQALANPNKYGLDGTADHHLAKQGELNGDMDGDGLTVGDAQAIQKNLLNLKSATIDIPFSMNTVRLDDKVNVQSSEGKNVDEEFAAAEMNFGIELLKKSFAPTNAGEENLLISTMSVSAALAMTANGADSKTHSEMEKVLGNGFTLDQINEY
ncbi:serpin family protein, partial [Ruminococcus sp.]|uniref:dockerin type I repeat-containing protein n=1 Tax=Ruminococcus sp. TaxID=41978 RepID=UPI0025FA7C0A